MRAMLPATRKAEMGVGTLIIFISLLLVAAVAAGVLIQTAGSLQQRALSTGTQATGQISTNAIALEVSAVDGSDGNVENFSQTMKLAPGSNSIKLSDVTLTYSTKDESVTHTYLAPINDSVYCTDPSNSSIEYTEAEDCAFVGTDTGNFTVEYLQTGSNSQEGTMVRGDVINIYLSAPNALNEGESVRINFIPKIGTSTLVEFSAPDVMSTQRVYLYP